MSSLQVVPGRLCGMGQSQAHQWRHVLLPALLAAVRTLGNAPTRSLASAGPVAWRRGDHCGDDGGSPGRGRCCWRGRASSHADLPPCAHDGTERRIVRPQDAVAPQVCESGKKTAHTVPNVRLVHASLRLFLLSATHGGRSHDKAMADTPPYPFPVGSRVLQELGFLACPLPVVELLMPTRQPRGEELTLEQKRATQARP